MKLKLGFLLFLCPFFGGNTKENTTLYHAAGIFKPVQAGEQMPLVRLNTVLNNDGKAISLSDYHGRLLILDFWATSCGSCIQVMPRLDSLQHLFRDQVVILPVTAESAAQVSHFQATNGFLHGLKFRTVVGDKTLHALFPHRLLPHEVWIDGSGKVLGFTEAEAVTAPVIRNALAGKGLDAPAKTDVLDYNQVKPLLVENNGGPDSCFSYRSVITRKLNGLPSSVSIRYDSLKKLTVIRATNVSVRRLYTIVFMGLRALPDDRVSLGPDRGLFCYELDLPGSSPAKAKRSVREDLDRFFGVQSEFTGAAFRLLPLTENDNNKPLTL